MILRFGNVVLLTVEEVKGTLFNSQCDQMAILRENSRWEKHSADTVVYGVDVSVSLVVCLFFKICLSLCQFVSQSVYLSVCLSVSQSVCQSVSLSVSQSVSLSVCLSVCLSDCMCICLINTQKIGIVKIFQKEVKLSLESVGTISLCCSYFQLFVLNLAIIMFMFILPMMVPSHPGPRCVSIVEVC